MKEQYKVLVGDCIQSMQTLEDQSVHCCVTSPPYFGLRDYGQEGQIGLEETPEKFVAKLVDVFREVRRVLRDDGTVWLNLGDSYNGSGGAGGDYGKGGLKEGQPKYPAKRIQTLKPKDLIGIPWRVAFALQADGWYLRQDIIWHKPNPMPESVRDRCTKAHEYIFLLSKSAKYYMDMEPIREPVKPSNKGSIRSPKLGPNRLKNSREMNEKIYDQIKGANKRSVWTVATKPYKGAHFATFPPDLIEPCILAGCPEGGTVLDPFGGSGTTAGVAIKNGRNAILCELNPEYAELIPGRIRSIAGDLNQTKLF